MERGGGDEWQVDSEGNLSPPEEPVSDEFGRSDPDTVEREMRRREREQRRRQGKPATEKKGVTGSFSKLSRRDKPRRARKPKAEKPPKAPKAPRAAKPPKEPRAPVESRMARRRAAAAARPPRDPTTYRKRRFAALALALAGILVVWFLVALFQPFAGDGAGDGAVQVEIPEGADSGDIAKILDDKGVISSASLFQIRLRLSGKSGDIQADNYSLAEGMSYGAVIDRLTGQETGGAITVTIPEGLSRDQIASDVLPEGVSSDEYLKLTESAPKGFDPAQYGAKTDNLEGFLFPATYDLPPNDNVQSLVDQQLQAFKDNLSQVDLSYAKKKNLTAYDVLIIASMIDKEVQVPKERPLVAAVIYNRLSRNIQLFIDATTRYETQNYTEPLTTEVLEKDTPYNTRTNFGLPPTPIGNPGLAAIKAAARPANVDYLYYVVKPGTCGEHNFTNSEAEFEKFAQQYQQALEEQGGSPTECPE